MIKMKTIPGFSNYAISKDGKVWSKPRKELRGHVLKGKWLKPGKTKDGYLFIILTKDFQQYAHRIHRLILETYVGPCPAGMECRHLDGNSTNNQLGNLKWGTPKENHQDSIQHRTYIGLKQKGEKHPLSKLKEKDVRMIIYMYRTGLFLCQEIAKIYKVVPNTVSRIVNKKRWKHLWT